jgi:Fe-S oxidoreductase
MSSASYYKDLSEEALICGRCGNCRSDCPTYREVGWESGSPRAKISLAREIFARGFNHMTPAYAKRVTECTMCGACTKNCACRIDLQKLWSDLRAKLVESGYAPKGYTAIVESLQARKNISNFTNDTRLDWAEDLDEVPDNLDCKQGAEVAYFVGCVSSFFPRAAQVPLAMVQLLQKAAVNFTTMGAAEWCCGFPLIAAGAASEMKRYARHNVDFVKQMGVKTLITGCSSCYHTWAHFYPEILGEKLDIRILHTTQYLAELIKEGKLTPHTLDEIVTYHDPCDLGRNGGVFDEPRQVIKSIPGITFVEMREHGEDSSCCGGGGNLQGADPVMADAIAVKRIVEAGETGAGILVSACQQCEQMLEKAARKQKLPIQVMDVAELLLLAVED